MRDNVVLIDPFFGAGIRDALKIPVLKPALIRKADVILLTHEHRDHCDPDTVKELAERTGATVVAPKETLAIIDINDRQKVDVKIGDRFQLKGIDFSVVKAAHPQSQYPVGYIINDYVKIYHAGDTYQFNDMVSINVDYAIIPIGGGYTMDPIDAANSTKLLRANFIIPIHYNTFDKISQDVKDFSRRVSHGKVIEMRPDESITIRK